MQRTFVTGVLLFLAVIAAAAALPPDFQETTFANGFLEPTAMAFAPDGRLFVAEKAGTLRVVKSGVLLPTPFLTVAVASDSERGLLGVTFDPNFAINRYVYIYYTRAAAPVKNRVSRFTASIANPDVAAPGSEVVLVDDIPSDAGNHNGGAIHFGTDGKLYIGIGDGGATPTNAQSLSSLSGKMLRINADGSIPPDNPFVGTPGARGEIWAYGLRNPFTFAIDPADGTIHINDVGQATWEEINLGTAGENYGWPTCEGPQNTGVGLCTSAALTYPIYAYPHNAAMAGPDGTFGNAITGGVFYRGTVFPAAYAGDYFFSDYTTTWLRLLDRGSTSAVLFNDAVQAVLDVQVGPDDALYTLSYYGRVDKTAYIGAGNRNPIAAVTATPISGAVPLTVSFSAAGSSDPDGDTLTYAWAFGDGGIAAGSTASHTYTTSGSYTTTLTVSDGRGGVATKTVSIQVGTPPMATITSPAAGALYAAGDTITYAGTATDAEDGVLPASAFRWDIVFHHDTHTHPFLGPIGNVQSGSFTIPKTGESSSNVWYRVSLTVTDSTGLSQTVFRDIPPRKSSLTLTTNPPGLTLTLDGQPQLTPLTFSGVVGFARTIGAPSPQLLSGESYTFASWSDGGKQTHIITTPAADTTYTAVFQQLPMEVCGDGVLQGSEVCDGTVRSCSISGQPGTQQCNALCSRYGICIATPICGNRRLDAGEICDGNSRLCTIDGKPGIQTCNVQCDGFSSCANLAVCGNGVRELAERCDGNTAACAVDGQPGTMSCNALCNDYGACIVPDQPTPSAAFVRAESTTRGNWVGRYGREGYEIINHAAQYPAFAVITPSGQTAQTWAASTTSARALRKGSATADRIAAGWVGDRFIIDVDLRDDRPHRFSLYLLDWEPLARYQKIEIFDPTTNRRLDLRYANNFANGKYYTWDLRGHVQVVVTTLSRRNAVASGIFLDPAITT